MHIPQIRLLIQTVSNSWVVEFYILRFNPDRTTVINFEKSRTGLDQKIIYQTYKDLFNDGSIGDPVDVSSKVSLEPTVEPPIPEPVEFPIKRNDDLDRFKSGPCYICTAQVKEFPDCLSDNVQMQLI